LGNAYFCHGLLAVVADGCIAVSTGGDDTLRLWNLKSGVCGTTAELHDGAVECIDIASSERIAVSGSLHGIVRVWDLATGACVRVFEEGDTVSALKISTDGSLAIVGLVWRFFVHDLRTGEILRTVYCRDSIQHPLADEDAKIAVSANWKDLLVWDLISGSCISTMKGHSEEISDVALTRNGRVALTGSSDGTVRVWNLTDRLCVSVLKGHSDRVNRISVTPDGAVAVSAGRDSTVRVWDLQTGTCAQILEGHSQSVYAVGITSNGKVAVSAGADSTLRIWNLTNGECSHTITGQNVNHLSISPDGSFVIASLSDKTLRLWDLQSGICLALALGQASWSAIAMTRNYLIAGNEGGDLAILTVLPKPEILKL
jgi:predicted NACHT family NTPase